MHLLAESPQLTRSASASSISSLDSNASAETAISIDPKNNVIRRTRKRFTNAQLIMLERLYRTTTHPTRELRDLLAKQGDMEMRSVTIWFQNKRQTERRERFASNKSFIGSHNYPFSDPVGKTIHSAREKLRQDALAHVGSDAGSTTASDPSRSQSPLGPSSPGTSRRLERRPSLDRIAARLERPHPPQTPPRRSRLTLQTPLRPHGLALWDSMPSSPPDPISDPQADRDLLDFGRGRIKRMRTLEWACAAASLGRQTEAEEIGSDDALVLDLGGDTEDESEAHEAVTPKGSQMPTARRTMRKWPERSGADKENVSVRVESGLEYGPELAQVKKVLDEGLSRLSAIMGDENMMDAALTLCVLGRQA